MKPTRIVALAVMLGAIALTSPSAQTLRAAQPPSEFPPASFKGKQYVDSRGCIYVRAGINGNVTWVPRVTRSRKQLCGYKPTRIAGTTRTPPAARGAAPPRLITLDAGAETAAKPVQVARPRTAPAVKPAPAAEPAATAKAARAVKPAAKPAARVAAAPAAAVRKPSPGPQPTVFHNPPANAAAPEAAAPTPRPAPRRAAMRKPSAAPAPTVWANPQPKRAAPAIAPGKAPASAPARAPARIVCANASAFSQNFINEGARCTPQKTPPVVYRTARKGAAPALDPNARIVPRHVYVNRQNTTNVAVPKGYRPAWKDDRLNPHRAERSARPSRINSAAVVPPGYRRVDRGDDRYNSRRGVRTAQGDAQTDLIWTRTVPRRLVRKPVDRAVVVLPVAVAGTGEKARTVPHVRISTRSAANAAPVNWPPSSSAETGR